MKTTIRLIILGELPFGFNKTKIEKWKSKLFEVTNPIDKLSITCNSDGRNWEYSDDCIKKQLITNFQENILIAITNVPLELNCYSRVISDNRVCITFYEASNILRSKNIPIENMVLKLLYSYTLGYLSHENNLPLNKTSSFIHDETRGCLFDMVGIKEDLIYSTNKPVICSSCIENLRKGRVSENLILNSQKEIKKINKKLYFKMVDFVKQHPVIAIFGSALFAIILGIISSLTASFIWQSLTN